MNLHMTSHPARPVPDELVPSRYALRIGEIDVLVVSSGILSLPTRMLAHDTDPAVRAAWLEDMFLPPEMIDWPLNVVLVRSGGRTILVDARLGGDPHLARAVVLSTGCRRHRSWIRDRRGADPHAHGPYRRAAHGLCEGAAASGPADSRGS